MYGKFQIPVMAGFVVSPSLRFKPNLFTNWNCWIGVISLDNERSKSFESIKGNPLATGLFVGGVFVYAGLAVYGSMVNPFFLSQSVTIGAYFNLQRLLVVVLSFFVSLLCFSAVIVFNFFRLGSWILSWTTLTNIPLLLESSCSVRKFFLGL